MLIYYNKQMVLVPLQANKVLATQERKLKLFSQVKCVSSIANFQTIASCVYVCVCSPGHAVSENV